MTLAFHFECLKNGEILSFLLQNFARNLPHAIERNGENITLFVSGEEGELGSFADHLAKNLPFSIFVKESKVLAAKDLPAGCQNTQNLSLNNITPSQIEKFLRDLEPCENEFSVLSDICVSDQSVNSKNFSALLEECVSKIKGGQGLNLKDKSCEYELKAFENFKDIHFIIPTNLKALPKVFVADERSQITLASFEKPIISLKTNSIYRQNHSQAPSFFDVKAAKDLFIYALGMKLSQLGVNFLGAKILKQKEPPLKLIQLENSSVALNNFSYFKMADSEILGDGGLNLEILLCKFSDDKINLARKNDKTSVLFVPKFSNFSEIYDEISKDEGGAKLLESYRLAYGLPEGDIPRRESFFSLLCVAGRIFGFSDDFLKSGEILLANAMDFNGAKGVRIDCKMKSKLEFDAVKFIKSGMSFYLAGAGERNISFGYIESMAYFLSDFSFELRDEFGVQNVLLGGSLFECKTASNLIKKHLNPNIKTKFDIGFGIEVFV